jgi:hypothetical protein
MANRTGTTSRLWQRIPDDQLVHLLDVISGAFRATGIPDPKIEILVNLTLPTAPRPARGSNYARPSLPAKRRSRLPADGSSQRLRAASGTQLT